MCVLHYIHFMFRFISFSASFQLDAWSFEHHKNMWIMCNVAYCIAIHFSISNVHIPINLFHILHVAFCLYHQWLRAIGKPITHCPFIILYKPLIATIWEHIQLFSVVTMSSMSNIHTTSLCGRSNLIWCHCFRFCSNYFLSQNSFHLILQCDSIHCESAGVMIKI